MNGGDGRGPSALDRLRALERAEAEQRSRVGGPGADGRPGDGQVGGGRKGMALGGLAALGLLLLKFKGVLLLLLGKLKFLLVGLQLLKLGPLLKTGSTMLLMIWAYALFYGWPFAAGFVVLILVHELGHGAAARLVGLRVGAPVFIPFFGAFIALKEQPRSTYVDFQIGAGGPLAGTLGGLACFALAATVLPGAGVLRAVGYFTLVINLFNLMPVWSLDGDRMTRPLTLRHWLPGAALLLGLTFFIGGAQDHLNPTVLILLLVIGFRTARVWWKERQAARGARPETLLERLQQRPPLPDEAEVTPGQRRIAAVTYFGLAGLLITLLHLTWDSLPAISG